MLLLLFSAGCDAVNPTDPIQFSGELAELRYTFATDGNGDLIENVKSQVVSDEVTDFLDNHGSGFSKSEIIGAEITSAAISFNSPPVRPNLDILNRVIVQVADGGATLEVANREDFPEHRDASLTVLGRDIASYAQAPSFEVIMQLDATEQLEPNEEYEFYLVLDARMELEGV